MKDDGNALPISPWKAVFGWGMMPHASLEGHESRPLAGACLARVNIFVLIIFILIKRPNHLRSTCLLQKNQYKKDKKPLDVSLSYLFFVLKGNIIFIMYFKMKKKSNCLLCTLIIFFCFLEKYTHYTMHLKEKKTE